MYLHPSDLRHANTRRIVRELLAHAAGGDGAGAPRTRADLARITGLSAVTAGKVVDALVNADLVEEHAADSVPTGGTPALGRPPRLLRLASRPRFIAVELGVRSTRVSALALGGADSPTDVSLRSPSALAPWIAAVRDARRTLGVARPLATLLSVPGVVDPARGEVVFSPNLHWTEGTALPKALAAACGADVCAVQEIQALALGHQAARGTDNTDESFLLIDFGDGVGGAVVAHGRLLESSLPLSGEIGHTAVPGNRRRCGCGAVGCLETLVSRSGIARSHAEARRGRSLGWDAIVRDVGSRAVRPWLVRSIEAAAVVIAGATNLLGIREIVVTGDLPGLHPSVIDRLGAGIAEHSLLARFGKVTCETAPRRPSLGLAVAAIDRVILPSLEEVTARDTMQRARNRALRRSGVRR